jgi:hypothetical protein
MLISVFVDELGVVVKLDVPDGFLFWGEMARMERRGHDGTNRSVGGVT